MTTEECRIQMADNASAEHDAILRAVQVLESALASPASGREEAWSRRVAHDLSPVVAAVVDHCRAAEAPGGLIREIEVFLGRHRVQTRASEEHRRLATEAEDFLSALATEQDAAIIRARAADLTADLRAHQAHEADLIYEAFVRDIGVGD